MADYDNTNRGALFVAKEKKTDKHPDYNGNINVDGKEFWISGWKSYSKKDGSMYLSLSINPKEPQSKPAASTAPKSAFGIDQNIDDDIPF